MPERLLIRLCILLVLCGLAAAGDANDRSLLTVERIFDSNEFKPQERGRFRWLEDGSAYTVLEDSAETKGGKDIVQYDPRTGAREIAVPARDLVPDGQSQPLKIDEYSWSKDRRKLLVFTNAKRVWRTNSRGDYWVLDLDRGSLKKLGGKAKPSTLMFAKFSPDGRRVAYLRDRNLYVQDLRTLKIRRLTRDGGEKIINGTGDWVYEEEFELRDGFQWSPDSKSIAYWQFDTSGVPEFSLINNTGSLYPQVTTIPYPKVGQKNSACRVGIVKASGGATRWLRVSKDLRNHYIPRMSWAVDSESVILQQLNRLQNTNEVIIADVRTGVCRQVLCEADDAWVEVCDGLMWLDEGKRFTWLSERDGWQHLYRISRCDGQATLLTPGQSDMMRLDRVDEKGGWAYYTASPDNPTQRYLYRVPLDGSAGTERITPLDQPGMHSYDISPDSGWALHTYSSFDVPPVTELVSLPDHKIARVLADNSQLREKVAALKRCPTEFFRVDIGNGVLLDAWCMKPPDFDPARRYPLLFHVYGEPAGQTVLDQWGGEKYLWHLLLAQRGCLVMSIDNRGTPAPRGRQWRKCIYRQIGILASADQAAAARQIIAQRPYIDPNRVGIWGWSGGGSMTLNAVFRYPDLYRTAIAIAFISNQRFYDTIYQERYMGLPDDNPDGYKNGSPITFAHQLEGNLLLIHGTGDDNCHYQNCEALIDELIRHKKQFRMMAYPNRTHSIKEGDNTWLHLYTLMTQYLEENLLREPSQITAQ
ncbi:MAG: S9 family peptidase [Sedimentisphaerales bacterium]|nr:S9 family peptidase [Sedimentisphaerales bacterium]